MSEQDFANDPPVTVIAVHSVKPGKEKAFEEIMSNLIEAAMTFEGHLGANVICPGDLEDSPYRIVFKFDRMSNLHHWENSEIRQRWLIRLAEMTQESLPYQILTGLETWFTLPGQRPVKPPPRYKMAFVTWLAIFPLITAINVLFGSFLNPLSLLLRSLVLTAMLVSLMTYIVMPRMTKLFSQWLYPKRKR